MSKQYKPYKEILRYRGSRDKNIDKVLTHLNANYYLSNIKEDCLTIKAYTVLQRREINKLIAREKVKMLLDILGLNDIDGN